MARSTSSWRYRWLISVPTSTRQRQTPVTGTPLTVVASSKSGCVVWCTTTLSRYRYRPWVTVISTGTDDEVSPCSRAAARWLATPPVARHAATTLDRHVGRTPASAYTPGWIADHSPERSRDWIFPSVRPAVRAWRRETTPYWSRNCSATGASDIFNLDRVIFESREVTARHPTVPDLNADRGDIDENRH